MATNRKQQIKKMLNGWQKNLLQYDWWEIALLVIGAVSIITIIVILFLPVGGASRDIKFSGTVPGATSHAFLDTMSGSLSTPVEIGEPIEILNNGDDFLPTLLEDIDRAQVSINFTAYIWKDGIMSDKIIEHLTAKAKEGVQVRVLLDGFGALTMPKNAFKELEDHGGKVERYNALSIAPWNLSHNHKRNHRRAIVIDGSIGYTGGSAVEDKWLGDARNPDEWRDMMFRVTGSMARELQGSFAELWASSTGEILVSEPFYQSIVMETQSSLRYIPLSSSPSSDVFLLHKMILLTLAGAEEKIYLTTPYFLPDPAMQDVLMEKARAGVDVRIIAPNELTDTQSVRYASQYLYERLLEAGVKIYEYQPTFIHSKYVIVDGVWTLIGSPNMDNRSRKINEENALGIYDAKFASEMEKVFFDDMSKTQEIILSEWKERGAWQRFREIFATKFVKQF